MFRSSSASSPSKRPATHAASWYTSSASRLDAELTAWLTQVDQEPIPEPEDVADPSSPSSSSASSASGAQMGERSSLTFPVPDCRAIIAPHAGYSYSGAAAAWAYRCIPSIPSSSTSSSSSSSPPPIKRVFILGPSHHHYLDACALSTFSAYETPLGDLPIDGEVNQEIFNHLGQKGDWQWMQKEVDEAEHSIEMHASYVRKVFQGQDITIVPILVGAISTDRESYYGGLLAPYLADAENFFVISSDFCHWGSRFSYTFYRPSSTAASRSLTSRTTPGQGEIPIHQSIRELDDEGIQAISFPRARVGQGETATSKQNKKTATEAKEAFATYLRRTKNTVCGRHPIAVLLGALAHLEKQKQGYGSGTGQSTAECRFVRYEQSSQCQTYRDSSVSYASAFVRFS